VSEQVVTATGFSSKCQKFHFPEVSKCRFLSLSCFWVVTAGLVLEIGGFVERGEGVVRGEFVARNGQHDDVVSERSTGFRTQS